MLNSFSTNLYIIHNRGLKMKFKIKKIRTNLRQKVLFGCLILIFLSLQLSFVWNVSRVNEIEDFNNLKPVVPVKTSATLISPISIDDTNPSSNWESFALAHIGDSWFTNATGTEGDPYIIDDVVINSGINCISIQNSRANFTIKNSEFTNSYPGQGIRLINVSYGHIENNNIAYNFKGMRLIDSNEILIAGNIFNIDNEQGILLENSHDNIIFGNTLINNEYGIVCDDSNGNIISNNDITNNRYGGLALYESSNNTVEGNTIKNNGKFNEYGNVVAGEGLVVGYRSSHNKILENNFSDNKYCGIGLSRDSGNTTVIGNNFDNNSMCAINLEETTNNNITANIMSDSGITFEETWDNMESNSISSTNLINNKPVYFYENRTNLKSIDFINAGQVILIKCNNSLISSLNVSHGSIGLTLIYCGNITLLNIEASNNILYGIYSIDSRNISISISKVNDNGNCGILFESCDNSKVLNNEANYNNALISIWVSAGDFGRVLGCGIVLWGGISNTISENDAHYNKINGLELYNSDGNLISGNIVSHNSDNGINLLSSDRNDVIGNTVSYNAFYGIIIAGNHNYVYDNTVNFQSGSGNALLHAAIYLDHVWNNSVVENNIAHNSEGIYLSYSGGNNISHNNLDDNGIWIRGNGNTISENTFTNSVSGLDLIYAHNNIITKNSFYEVYYVIDLYYSDYNNISENYIDGNGGVGLDFFSSSYNTIEGNEIYDVQICFREDDSSLSNVFANNTCSHRPPEEDNIIIYIIIGGALGGAAIAIVLIRRRSVRKRNNNK